MAYTYIYIIYTYLIASEIPNSSDSLATRLPVMEKPRKSHGKVMEDTPDFLRTCTAATSKTSDRRWWETSLRGVSTGQQTEGWLAILNMEHISIELIDR
jgi:hypothetical protein